MTNRTCATCASFIQLDEPGPRQCGELVSFIDGQGTPFERHRSPIASDSCPMHQSAAEDTAQSRNIDANRDQIVADIRHHIAEQEQRNQERHGFHAAELDAQRAAREVLSRFRLGRGS